MVFLEAHKHIDVVVTDIAVLLDGICYSKLSAHNVLSTFPSSSECMSADSTDSTAKDLYYFDGISMAIEPVSAM